MYHKKIPTLGKIGKIQKKRPILQKNGEIQKNKILIDKIKKDTKEKIANLKRQIKQESVLGEYYKKGYSYKESAIDSNGKTLYTLSFKNKKLDIYINNIDSLKEIIKLIKDIFTKYGKNKRFYAKESKIRASYNRKIDLFIENKGIKEGFFGIDEGILGQEELAKVLKESEDTLFKNGYMNNFSDFLNQIK